ncbi:MAG TPA: hypothetical protein DIT04_01505 [Dysgonomonas sp.]|nr:hypothetical protein [Dysgonomonas sp.]
MSNINNIDRLSKKDVLLNILFIFFLCYLSQLFIRQVFQIGYNYNGVEFYHISEWLINFEGGFVRRGIRGEIILFLYNVLGLKPFTSIIIITAISFILLLYFFFSQFIKQGYPIFILPFAFFLGNPILNSFWLRPDSLLLLTFILIIYACRKNRITAPNILLINILSIFGILMHEIFIFIALPFIILLIARLINQAYNKNLKNKILSYFLAGLCLTPCIIITLLVILHNGSPAFADKILSSWNTIPFPDGFQIWSAGSQYPGAFEGMTKTMSEGLNEYSGQFINWFFNSLYGPLLILLTIGVVFFILSNINKINNRIIIFKPQDHKNKSSITSVLLIQLTAIIPLYILGWDYGRWIFFWAASSFVVLLLIPQQILHTAIPSPIIHLSDKLNNWSSSVFGESKGVVILLCLIIGVPFSVWGAQEYFDTSLIYILLKNISLLFKYILMVLR